MFVFRPWRAEDGFLRSMFDWPTSRFALPAMEGDYALSLGALPLRHATEEDDALTLVFEAPGATADDVSLTYEAGRLTVSVDRGVETPGGRICHAERPHGRLSRQIELGRAYDPDSIEATLDEGLLVVRAIKRPEARPREIPIASASAPQLEPKTGGEDHES
ncbi:MAG TPA: Hsp20/alpha crystallin family protein [Polyangiaceae bacterium]|nr:Hsp20/alpha crystallin family protein [Polyangiaceae bacterium]